MTAPTTTPTNDWKHYARQLAAFDPATFGPPPGDDWQPDAEFSQYIKDAAEVTALRAEVAELRRLAHEHCSKCFRDRPPA